MKQIVGQSLIQQCCVKLTCGPDRGTGFFIDKSRILTAYHVILDNIESGEPITYTSNADSVISCNVVAVSQKLDLCVLEGIYQNDFWLPLLAANVRVGEQCILSGFPQKLEANFAAYSGIVAQLLLSERSDFQINASELNKDFDYGGFSGGPIVIGNHVTGIILRQVDDSITGISISKAASFIRESNIPVEEEYIYHEVPPEFEAFIASSSPNYNAIDALNKALGTSSNWIVVQGSPGSGKTTFAASFKPSNESHIIFGRYFLKVPNDSRPATLRTSPEFFFETIENLLSSIISGETLPKKEIDFKKRQERFLQLLSQANDYFSSKSKVGILLIDGIDESLDVNTFLNPLPPNFGISLKVIISCASLDKVPVKISAQLAEDNLVTIIPLEMDQCEALIRTELQSFDISIDTVQKLAIRSEGHPLYLRYLINFFKVNPPQSSSDVEKWINSMPMISGDITRYYESIWSSIYSDSNKLWILIILSQLRQPVSKEQLYAILPDSFQLSFSATYPSVAFLLSDNEQIQVYHNSFKEFILSKTLVDRKKANDIISEYCTKYNTTEFAYNNIVFHLAKGSNPMQAVDNCSQSWADQCALNDVAPDLVIDDIKLCVSLSLDKMEVELVIRLLLLLERISFRYNSVLKENATNLALALVALGKYNAALKYVVRDNTILVSNNDAILFLQQFYENEAWDEAATLLQAIDSKYRKAIQEGFESEEGLDIRILSIKLNSLTLYMNDEFKDALERWMYFQGKYRILEKKVGGDSGIGLMREHCASWQLAYIIRQFDRYNNHKKIAEVTKMPTTKRHATILSKSALIFDQFNTYNCKKKASTERFRELIEDVEEVCLSVGYEKSPDDLRLITAALTLYSKNEELTVQIVNEFLNLPFEFKLRKTNGVDLDYSAVNAQLFISKCQGYVDNIDAYPALIIKSPRAQNWEEFVISLIKLTGFIEGKLLRLKAGASEDIGLQIDKHFDALIERLSFKLDERKYWDRSYHIPEGIFPVIVTNLVDIVNQHRPQRLQTVVALLTSRTTKQFGLYTEGYRSCLFEACTSCIRHGADISAFSVLLEAWHQHALQIENRWERTQELLKIVEHYALVKDNSRALKVFQDMLDTSMGPTWYKESQLSLLIESLKLKPPVSTATTYINKFGTLLDFASGEMTFQRYVRNEKESFVESLSQVKDLATAIEYFKFEVIPPANILIWNAESKEIDSAPIGDGYCLGARNITEAAAIRGLIEKSDSAYVRWFLSLIFIVNDDTFRYVQDYAEIQAACLNDLHEDGTFLKNAAVQINQLIEQKEIQEGRNLYEYFNPLYTKANEFVKNWLEKNISFKIDWTTLKAVKSEKSVSEEPDAFDKFNGNVNEVTQDRSEILKNGFKTFQESRINIWYRNWSVSSNLTRATLKAKITSPEEALTYLKPFINEYGDHYWNIAAEILWFIRSVVKDDQKDKIMYYITEHFEYIVRPDAATAQKYAWLSLPNPEHEKGSDNLLVGLMIWLLNHPVEDIQNKAHQGLLDLSQHELAIVVSAVINEIITNRPHQATEQCSFILKTIAEKYQGTLAKLLSKQLVSQLSGVRHFTIKKNLLDTGLILAKAGDRSLLEAIEASIDTSAINYTDVAFEEEILEPIQNYIDHLNGEQLLNRAFCEEILNLVNRFCQPNSPREFKKSDRYLLRSFYVEQNEGSYDHLLKHCLNMAILPRVERAKYEDIFEILN